MYIRPLLRTSFIAHKFLWGLLLSSFWLALPQITLAKSFLPHTVWLRRSASAQSSRAHVEAPYPTSLTQIPTLHAQKSNQVLVKVDPKTQAKLMAQNGALDDLLISDRPNLLAAIDHSIRYIRTPSAVNRYPVAGISRDRMERSLMRFRQLVQNAPDSQTLQAWVMQEFDLYRSVGLDRRGTVQFTGYFEAVYPASRTRTEKFRYPLYALPSDFPSWAKPHPPRAALEGSKRLKGSELAWLSDRFQAFLVHVQGSARLQMLDRTTMTIGYAGKTDRPYTSIGAEIVRDGKMRLEDVTLQSLMAYFQKHPHELVGYLHRNQSFVFFRETKGAPAQGSIGVPVTAERSIATDKSLMPPGGLALIRTILPMPNRHEKTFTSQFVNRFVLDQDTGGAIKGAGRVDIFMGTGQLPKERSGLINADGELYYLVIK